MEKRIRRIVLGANQKAIKARRLYREISSGARWQQRIQGIYEKQFFNPNFESKQLIEKAVKLKGSTRQRIELREYAKRLARKRNYALERFKAWGLKPEHLGKPIAKTPSGVSAKKILYNLTGWYSIGGKVEMIATTDAIAFIVGPKDFRDIVKKEVPKTKKAKAIFLPGAKAMDAMVFPTVEKAKECLAHEIKHAVTAETPLIQELVTGKKNRFNKRTLEQFFLPSNLRLGAKVMGRALLDELIANLAENDLHSFERKYKTRYLGDYLEGALGPKTAKAFMHNKGNYKQRILNATGQSIKAVRNALSSYVTTDDGRRVKVVNREQLGALLANIRDIERVPKRLPVLIALRKKELQKKLAYKMKQLG